jgi:alpha-glucosidase
MNSIKKVFFLISIFFVFNNCGTQNSNSDSISVNSPNGKIRVEIYKDADSKLLYKVEASGKLIITPSRLGIVSDSIDLGSNIRFGSVKSDRIDETYSVFGFHNEAVNRCKEKTVEIQTEGENWFLDIR